MFLTSEDMHPMNCTWDKYCVHCTWGVTEWHPDPSKCWQCQDVGRIVNEPYAVQIRVWDRSHRKRRVKVNIVRQIELNLNGVS